MQADEWDERYRGNELIWGSGPNRFVVEEVENMESGSALDVACGEGRNAIWLAERGWKVLGVDFSPVALGKAGRMADERGVTVEWLRADLVGWKPPARYDLVVVMYLHLPPTQRRAVFGSLAAAVNPGGTLLVVGHDRSNLTEGHGGPQDPTILYDAEEVAGDLAPMLEIERAERVFRNVETPDGDKVAIDTLVRAHR